MTIQSHPTLAALLADETWARGLARALVGDARGDDLLHDAYVAVLRRPSTLESSEPSAHRPWFGTVLRNAARSTHRGNARRAEREQRAAREESDVEQPDAILLRVEQRRQLAELLLALPDELRTALVLRYEEGFSGAEISRRTGTPEGTVRSRLKRGLAELREQLDRQNDGDRKAWIAALVPLTRESKAAVAAASAGSLVAFKLVAAAAVIALVTWTAVTQLSSRSGNGELGAEAAATATFEAQQERVNDSSELRARSRVDANPTPGSTRESRVASPSQSAATADRGSAEPAKQTALAVTDGLLDSVGAAPETSLRVRFVDDSGRGIPNVELKSGQWGRNARATSDSHGVAELSTRLVTRPNSAQLFASTSDWRVWESNSSFAPGTSTDLGDVRLSPPRAVVMGRVVGPSGSAVNSARVLLTPTGVDLSGLDSRATEPEHLLAETTTVHGNFRIVEPRAIDARLWYALRNTRWIPGPNIELIPGQGRVDLELHVQPEDLIRRTRLTFAHPDGQLLEGGHCGVHWESGGYRSGPMVAAGFEVSCFSPPTSISQVVGVLPEESLAVAWSGRLVEGDDDLVLELEPMAKHPFTLELGATQPTGAVQVLTHATKNSSVCFDSIDSVADLRDSMQLSIPQRGEFSVTASIEGYRKLELGPFTPATAPRPIILDLEPLEFIEGRVTFDGHGVANATVTPLLPVSGQKFWLTSGVPALHRKGRHGAVTTAADGSFQIDSEEPELAAFEVTAEGYPLLVAEHREPLVLELVRGGDLDGTVRTADGTSPAGTIVLATRGASDAETVRVDSSGRFAFDKLAPGDWFVTEGRSEIRGKSIFSGFAGPQKPSHWRHPHSVLIRSGETTRFDFTLAAANPVDARGTVSVDGAPPSGWTAEYVPASDDPFDIRPSVEATFGPDGSIRARLEHDGHYVLRLRGRNRAGIELLLDHEVLDIASEPHQRVAIDSGTLVLDVHADDDSSNKRMTLRGTLGGGRTTWLAHVLLNSPGTARFEAIPAGSVRLLQQEFLAPESPIAEGQLKPGGTLELDVR